MATHQFIDEFDRVDGEVGPDYIIACGGAALFDEVVLPVDIDEVNSGQSPALQGTTDQKSQVLYTSDILDNNDYAVRAVWSRMSATYTDESGLVNDPSFTILARMTKDPVLLDLGVEEEPLCYDQGYGLRVTCPRTGAAPILKLVKYTPNALVPGVPPPASTETDEAIVLTTATLVSANLNTDPSWDGSGDIQYQGYVQDMRLRIRRADDMVILEAYLNDRNRNTPIMTYTDYHHPMWGEIGVPGFEFISAATSSQGAANSPFELNALPLMMCHLFEVETVKDIAPPRVSTPANRWTYGRVAERAILLVEKQGDAKYTASLNGQTKKTHFLDFVYEAEREILAAEGYWWFLLREGRRVYLKDQESRYELPEDCGEVIAIMPGNWDNTPLVRMVNDAQWGRSLAGASNTSGFPRIYRYINPEANDRRAVQVWPTPAIDDTVYTEGLYMLVDYYARQFEPADPDSQAPLIPQDHIDVLTYKAAALALTLDTDPQNTQFMDGIATGKFAVMRRKNNRKVGDDRTVMRYEGNILAADRYSILPQTRRSSLGYHLP